MPRRSRDGAPDEDKYRIDCPFLPSFNSGSALALVTILLSLIVPVAVGTDEKVGILVITQQPYSGDRVCDRTRDPLPVSGAPLMAIVAVIVIMTLVGAGLWLKRD